MRSIVFDELPSADLDKLAGHLAANCRTSALPEVFWLDLPPDLLTAEQSAHQDCGPQRVALILENDSLRCELLVRSRSSLRCSCTAYANQEQRRYLLEFLDRLVEDLGIRT